MKRSTPLTRKAPLDHGTKGLQRTGISRTSTLGRGKGMPRSTLPCPSSAPKAKKPTVSPEEKRARRLVKARSGGRCEVGCYEPASDWSHRVARSQGGPWCPSNGVALCAGHHRWLHANPAAARDQLGWRLRSTDKPAEMPVLLADGWVLLDTDGGYTPVDADDALRALAA